MNYQQYYAKSPSIGSSKRKKDLSKRVKAYRKLLDFSQLQK